MKSFLLCLLGLLYLPVFAGVVPVREVKLTVFEKQVTGYRVSIAMGREDLRAGIKQYFAGYATSPIRMQEGLIFENLTYPPITTAKPITLYYMLGEQEGIFTELTLVGLYTYQQDISVHSFPDLSLRMLLDLSEMVQGLTGDPVDFDALFERQSVSEIQQRYQERKERNFMEFYVQREGDWIGSNDGTLIKENPFGDNRPENFTSDEQVVELINSRFKNYIAQNRDADSPFLNDSSQRQILVWRDSTAQLMAEILRLEGEQDSLLALIPDSNSIQTDTVLVQEVLPDTQLLAERDARIAALEADLEALQSTARMVPDTIWQQQEVKGDSSLLAASQQSIAELEGKVGQLELKLALSQERQDSLQQLLVVDPEIQADTIQQTLANQKLALAQLQGVLVDLETDLDLSEQRQDSLQALLDSGPKVRIDTFYQEAGPDSMSLAKVERLETELALFEERQDSLQNLLDQQRTQRVDTIEVPVEKMVEVAADDPKLQAQLLQLQQRNRVLEEESTAFSQINQDFQKLQIQYDQLLDRFELRGRVLEESGSKVDQLESRVIRLTQDNLQILAEKDSLVQELIILNPESEAARLRREVYRRQLEQLTETQQAQTKREQELARREKQVEQRERYLAEFEATGESQSLLSRIIQLENQLKTQEQENERLREQNRLSKADFEASPLNSSTNSTGFRFKPGVSDAFAEEQILSWFRLRGINAQPDGKAFTFSEVLLPRISNQLLRLQFQALDNGLWEIRFQTGKEGSLQPIPVDLQALEGLLAEIFR